MRTRGRKRAARRERKEREKRPRAGRQAQKTPVSSLPRTQQTTRTVVHVDVVLLPGAQGLKKVLGPLAVGGGPRRGGTRGSGGGGSGGGGFVFFVCGGSGSVDHRAALTLARASFGGSSRASDQARREAPLRGARRAGRAHNCERRETAARQRFSI